MKDLLLVLTTLALAKAIGLSVLLLGGAGLTLWVCKEIFT
jgi:hypothetical protein